MPWRLSETRARRYPCGNSDASFPISCVERRGRAADEAESEMSVHHASSKGQMREIDSDFLVIGSGAAGLSAAVTAAWRGLKVIVVEKDAVCGGATAWSGGWMWIPRNRLSQAEGIIEDIELPRTYLRHELGTNYDAARVD